MNPNDPYHTMGHYPQHYTHVNPAKFNIQWNQPIPASSSLHRGNFIHVNPAFFTPVLAPQIELTNPKRIIVNPKFFPQIQQELVPEISPNGPNIVNSGPNPPTQQDKDLGTNINRITVQPKARPANPVLSHQKVTQTILHPYAKPSPIRHASDRKKLTKLGPNSNPLRNKYKWRKIESPLKNTAIVKHAYKLVRKAPVLKSPKLASLLTLRAQNDTLKMFTPPKLTSTPIETRSRNSRFKLDNRSKTRKKTAKGVSPRASFPKALQNKYQMVRNKIWKPSHLTLAKFSVNRSVVNRSFTNFKSPLCRPIVHHSRKLQRLVDVVKLNKSTKKTKTARNKTRKRYYDDQAKAKSDDEVLDDVEIGEKPSGPKIRTPIGSLPSFITL